MLFCRVHICVKHLETYFTNYLNIFPRNFLIISVQFKAVPRSQGVLPNNEVGRRGGGLGSHIRFGGKIWSKVRPSSPTKRKIWEVLSLQDAKVGKSPNFGVISEIQRAKFGVFVIYIFGGKIWGSNKNFRGKIWGQAPRPS